MRAKIYLLFIVAPLLGMTGCAYNSPGAYSPRLSATLSVPIYNRGGTNVAQSSEGDGEGTQSATGESLQEGGGTASAQASGVTP